MCVCVRVCVALRLPTLLTAVAPTDTEAYNYPVRHVIPPVTLARIVGLKNIKASNGNRGNAPQKSRAVDVVAKVLEISEPRESGQWCADEGQGHCAWRRQQDAR